MKNIATKLSLLLASALLLTVAYSFRASSGEWKVPEEYEKKANPVKADDASISAGKSLWTLHCKSCHGKYGEGDGPKAANLETFPGDFTLDAFQDQTDGALFYKSKFGRDEMPSFEKKIPDDKDIWHLVNYMRDL